MSEIDDDVLFSVRMEIQKVIDGMKRIADALKLSSNVSVAVSDLRELARNFEGTGIVLDAVIRGDDIS